MLVITTIIVAVNVTYALGFASADVVREADDVEGVAHEDGGLDGAEGGSAEGAAGAAAEGSVHDLAALGVADQDNLGVGAPLVEVGDGLDDGGGTLASRVLVADAAAVGLAAAGRVDDGLLGGAGVSPDDHVDETGRGAVALGHGGLTSTEDVNTGA